MSSLKSRPYRMQKRAEHVDDTRRRITAAAARLHTTIGPANTTVAAIADEAGVTRLTVYRHFADLDVLFEACRAHWRAENPPPEAAAWAAIPELEDRVRTALTRLYGWYREHAEELFPIYRDITAMPSSSQTRMRDENRRLGQLLVGDAEPTGVDERLLIAASCHVLDYRTWRSLAIAQGLSDAEAVMIGVRLLTKLGADPRPSRGVRPRRCRGGA
ncbi:MAG TPA: helix-turn-helix domain-containing protein [Candidatus Limnocylindrales bacterium]